jgi:pyruvate dehydrogenase E1 component beta subunit
MVPHALQAAEFLLEEEEIYADVIAIAELSPPDLAAVLPAVERSGRCVFAEEGTVTGGVGAEWAARIQREAWPHLKAPVGRVAMPDTIIPCSKEQEAALLPGAGDIAAAVMALR